MGNGTRIQISSEHNGLQLDRNMPCCTRTRWRSDEERTRGADPTTASEPAAEARAGDLVKSRGLVCEREQRDTEALFGFVRVNQATLPVRAMCRLLNISKSGYYAWDERPMCERARVDIALSSKIDAIHRRSRGTYGSPNIHAELSDDHGIRVGRKRVARLMRAANIRGVTLRRFVVTTRRDPGAKPVVDLVERRFYAVKFVGWAMGNHLNTELMLAALDMAIAQRRPAGVIHHSDRGCQYTSYAFGKRCTQAGIRPSMGRVGDAYDNAMAESFFATLEREVIDRQRFHSQIDARMAVFTWLESWYNPHRRHSSLGYRSPMNYERHALRQKAA